MRGAGMHCWTKRLTIVALTMVLFIPSPITAWAATSITLTWVRHGQSVDNVYGYNGTVAPGPNLSNCAPGSTACVDQWSAVPGPSILPGFTQRAPGGVQQAQALVQRLIDTGLRYDAIYASTLVRTQQTAQPYADYRGMTITVLDGLREVRAGADEGADTNPPDARMQNYIDVQTAWRSGLVLTPMPQSPYPSDANGDLNGIVFNDRTNTAVEKIYWDEMNKYPTFTADALNPDANPLAFSHRGTITSWVLMNVSNPDLALVEEHPLENTLTAVVIGNPLDGWTLVNWAGVPVSPTPSLGTALYVDLRDYALVWQRSIWNVAVAQQSGFPSRVLQALGAGVGQIATATVRLPRDVLGSFADSLVNALQPNIAATVRSAERPAKASISASALAARASRPDKAPMASAVRSGGATHVVAMQRPQATASTSASQQRRQSANGRPPAANANKRAALVPTPSEAAAGSVSAE